MQIINIRQDKNKRIFLGKNGWKVVDIWESEIYWNKDLVKDKIRAISLTEKRCPYTADTGVQFSHCPPDWSEQIKRLWFKTDRPKRIKRNHIKLICSNSSCRKEFEAID